MATFEEIQILTEQETARIERKQELKEALDEQSDKLERRIVETMADKESGPTNKVK